MKGRSVFLIASGEAYTNTMSTICAAFSKEEDAVRCLEEYLAADELHLEYTLHKVVVDKELLL